MLDNLEGIVISGKRIQYWLGFPHDIYAQSLSDWKHWKHHGHGESTDYPKYINVIFHVL